MPLPWLRILDAFIGVTDLARSRRIRQLADPPTGERQSIEVSGRALGGLETRLAGVVVAALKEAFDRDTRRLELEREQLEAERRRAERALRLEWLRQAGEREIGRLRLVAAVAVAGWIGTLFLVARLPAAGARVTLGAGWLCLLASIAASFAGQSTLGRAMQRAGGPDTTGDEPPTAGLAGSLAAWLVVAGLILSGIAVLM
jgi:hypothetical protein